MKTHYPKTFVLATGVLVAALSPLSYAATYYVDANSTLAGDGNLGTTIYPFRTISQAASIARAGDTVIVKAGKYSETVHVKNSGEPGKPITFVASGTAIITPPYVQNWTGAFNIVGKTDVIVRGFTLQNAYFGIKVDRDGAGTVSQRIRLENNHTIMTESSGIRVAFARDVTVDSNVVEKANFGGVHEMISVIRTDGFVINKNEVFNGGFQINGVPMEGKEGIDIKSGSSNGRVTKNIVHDLTRLGIYLDASSSGVSNVEVSGNVVYRTKHGIALASEGGGTMENVLISNNVTFNNVAWGIIVSDWLKDGPRKNIRVFNNTAYGNGQGGINISTRNGYLIHLRNNIAAFNNGPQLLAANVGLLTSSLSNLVYGKNSGNILFGVTSGDPRFVDAARGNFRLNKGSVAINKGVTLSEVPVDILGKSRPQGGRYDIGAYESR